MLAFVKTVKHRHCSSLFIVMGNVCESKRENREKCVTQASSRVSHAWNDSTVARVIKLYFGGIQGWVVSLSFAFHYLGTKTMSRNPWRPDWQCWVPRHLRRTKDISSRHLTLFMLSLNLLIKADEHLLLLKVRGLRKEGKGGSDVFLLY